MNRTRVNYLSVRSILLVVALCVFSIKAHTGEHDCYSSIITEPVPFHGNGGEIIILEDGSTWKESHSRYLDLNKQNPNVKICPSERKLYLDDHVFSVIPIEKCYKTTIEKPNPFNGNGGETLVFSDGSIWWESSYQYLNLYKYNPAVLVCPGRGEMMLENHVFSIRPIK